MKHTKYFPPALLALFAITGFAAFTYLFALSPVPVQAQDLIDPDICETHSDEYWVFWTDEYLMRNELANAVDSFKCITADTQDEYYLGEFLYFRVGHLASAEAYSNMAGVENVEVQFCRIAQDDEFCGELLDNLDEEYDIARWIMAHEYSHIRRYDEAIALAQVNTDQEWANFGDYSTLVTILVRAGKHNEALAAANFMLVNAETNREYERTYRLLGEIYFTMQDYEQGNRWYNEALVYADCDYNPLYGGPSVTMQRFIFWLIWSGQDNEALEFVGTCGATEYAIAHAYALVGRFDEALEMVSESGEPENMYEAIMMRIIYEGLGNTELAEEYGILADEYRIETFVDPEGTFFIDISNPPFPIPIEDA